MCFALWLTNLFPSWIRSCHFKEKLVLWQVEKLTCSTQKESVSWRKPLCLALAMTLLEEKENCKFNVTAKLLCQDKKAAFRQAVQVHIPHSFLACWTSIFVWLLQALPINPMLLISSL